MASDTLFTLDLVIIGAGVYGICAASTYLSLHPEANIIVLDADEDVGGVWSTSRQYPLFWSQTGARVSGFPDKPFQPPAEAERYHDLIEAKWLAKYLEDYVSGKVYDGRGLRERFLFGTWARDVQKVTQGAGEGLWRVEAKQTLEGEKVYWSKKVIVATGLSSLPNMPSLPGKEAFQGPIVHQKDIGRSKLLTPDEPDLENHHSITIYGGSKSAADLAYAAAKDTSLPNGRHRTVNWIIRTAGSGPLSFVDPKLPPFLQGDKYRNLTETGTTRAMACLSSANPYLPANSWREWCLYRNPVGEWLLEKLFRRTEAECVTTANFEGREGALEGFEGLRSKNNVRWRTGPLGLLQREDFWDVVARKVRVWRGDVVEVKEDRVVLQDGREVRSDVLVCATGWKQEFPFLSAEESARLGIPIALKEEGLVQTEEEHWRHLDEDAEKKVYARWPYLKHIPDFKKMPFATTPYRLYRYTVPISDHSIAFLGLPLVPNSYHTALVQSLYAISALADDSPALPSKGSMEEDVAFVNAWCRIRYPVHGHLGNVLEYEMVSFTDRMLEELRLSSHRLSEKERRTWSGWWRDLSEPCLAGDYAGLVDEFRRRYLKLAD